MSSIANPDEARFWNSAPGQLWVEHQADLDAILSNVGDLVLDASAAARGEVAMDVGCGAATFSISTLYTLSDPAAPVSRTKTKYGCPETTGRVTVTPGEIDPPISELPSSSVMFNRTVPLAELKLVVNRPLTAAW